ncbi:hypothetical protein ACI8AC_24330 [Geodermatophilus sp. SYSU D00758]
MFRKKTHGQIIGEELQEGFSHLGTAVAEAGRAAAEQLAPRVEAAREASGPALQAAKVAVAPKVAAAAAIAAPAVAQAREAAGRAAADLSPRVEAARDALTPRVEAARESLSPRVEAYRDSLAPRVEAARIAAQEAAADLGPRFEAARESARRTLEKDVGPRLTAAQAAALAYATPRVLAARESLGPALESARDSLAGVLEELDLRREELAASTDEARKQVAKRRRALEKRAAKQGGKVSKGTTAAKRRAGQESPPRRWPWAVLVLAVGAVAFSLLRRRTDDDLWTPAPAGDGPVPSYREDPVPSSPSNSEKAVSTAQETAGDATPPDSDLGEQPQQMAYGDAENSATPGTATTSSNDPALDTATASPTDRPQTASSGLGSDAEDPRNPAT